MFCTKRIAVALIVLWSTNAFAQGEKIELLVSEVVSAKSPANSSDRYRALFELAGKERLSQLKFHENNSIAINSAWKEAMNSLPDDDTNSIVPSDPIALNRFVGFAEGRLQIAVPKWWIATLIPDASIKHKKNRKNREPTKDDLVYHNSGLNSVSSPVGTSLTHEGDQTKLKIGNESITLPLAISSGLDSYGVGVSGCFTADHCFVCVHDIVGSPHSAWAISRKSGKIEWERRVCGCWYWGTTGHHESRVSVAIQNGKLVIFGEAGTGFYLAGLSPESGKVLFEFSTGYGLRN